MHNKAYPLFLGIDLLTSLAAGGSRRQVPNSVRNLEFPSREIDSY